MVDELKNAHLEKQMRMRRENQMTTIDRSAKVINLQNKIANKKNILDNQKAERSGKIKTRVVAVTSGKGGVGKTNIIANLGFILSRLGKKVLIFDADLGLGNLDILLGLTPKYNFSHVITGEKSIKEIILEGPGNMKILPASSGIQELTRLSREQTVQILTELDVLINSVDILLIDTAAGISSNVMYFNSIAQEILVVVSPEPTSITDAYALMKVLSKKYSVKRFKLMVNMASEMQEAQEVFRQLNLVADRFLDITIEYMGHVLFDENVTKCVKFQKIVSEIYPETKASRCLDFIAQKINKSPFSQLPKGDTNFIWKDILLEKID